MQQYTLLFCLIGNQTDQMVRNVHKEVIYSMHRIYNLLERAPKKNTNSKDYKSQVTL